MKKKRSHLSSKDISLKTEGDLFGSQGHESPSSQPGQTAKSALSIGELTSDIRELLENRYPLVWVRGEISNFRSPGSGHLYFTLKDEKALLAAVMFRGDATQLPFFPKDGTAVLARGSLTLYEPRGQYQLRVVQLQRQGQGSLQEKFEALKKKLQSEGLFESSRKRPLPIFPKKVGIVTSSTGAALHDFCQVLHRRAPGIEIYVRGVRVQGDSSSQEIVQAIEAFNRESQVDLLVLARGGGSLEDLWSFNEEIVARALAASRLPTLCGVGHETDFTIADFVADVRAPTPSAAAELVSRAWSEWQTQITHYHRRLDRAIHHYLHTSRALLNQLSQHYVFREPQRVVERMQQRVDEIHSKLSRALQQGLAEQKQSLVTFQIRWQAIDLQNRIEHQRKNLAHWQARLQSLSPQATLDRGFALVLDEQGHLVREWTPSLVGTSVQLQLAQTSAQARIEKLKPSNQIFGRSANEG